MSKKQKLSEQMKRRVSNSKPEKTEKSKLEGNTKIMTSTGSTLLDLAISGLRVRGGGLPGGILVELFGPSGAGKTTLLQEIGGIIQAKGGELMFHDPEGRLNVEFAKMFDMNPEDMDYQTPDTVPQLFKAVREWNAPAGNNINGIMADSLAALSTDMEMGDDEGDKMGGRRAKEFSQELRKIARILKDKNYLMVCSNQIRETMSKIQWAEKYVAPGGQAIGFYSSVRLQIIPIKKLFVEETYKGKKLPKEYIGVRSEVYVYKNSVSEPYKRVPVSIYFRYGIDDVRENLQFIKDHSTESVYTLGEEKLDKSMEKSISIVEDNEWEEKLREEVINTWEAIQKIYDPDRKHKKRF